MSFVGSFQYQCCLSIHVAYGVSTVVNMHQYEEYLLVVNMIGMGTMHFS